MAKYVESGHMLYSTPCLMHLFAAVKPICIENCQYTDDLSALDVPETGMKKKGRCKTRGECFHFVLEKKAAALAACAGYTPQDAIFP